MKSSKLPSGLEVFKISSKILDKEPPFTAKAHGLTYLPRHRVRIDAEVADTFELIAIVALGVRDGSVDEHTMQDRQRILK